MANLFARVTAEWSGRGYTEVRRLGGGTNGRVVLARADWSGALVAIRYLPARLFVDRRRTAAFRADLAAFRRLRDLRVARIRYYAEDPRVARLDREVPAGDGAAVVTDAVDGVALSRMLHGRRTLPAQAALAVLKQSLLALASVHALGLVYRDYKPSRLVVGGRGSAKLLDAGIAVLSPDGGPPGQPAYRAPELWRGGHPSPVTDVYAASCVFFECLVGERPYRAVELFSLMGGHTVGPVPVHEVPELLRPLLLLGMAKDPASRPSAVELVAHLNTVASRAYGPRWEWAGLAELAAIVPPFLEPFPPRIRGHRARLVVAMVVVVAALAVMAAAAVVRHPTGSSVDGAPPGQARPTATSFSSAPAPPAPIPPAPAPSAPAPPAPIPTLTTPTLTTRQPDGECSSVPGLTVSPSSGDVSTLITVSGFGVVADGMVEVIFHADVMGSATTTGDGCFQVTVPIPNADHYGSLPGPYDIHITEFDSDGTYVGNGPHRQSFLVTRS